jgi:hypothetical protein
MIHEFVTIKSGVTRQAGQPIGCQRLVNRIAEDQRPGWRLCNMVKLL